MTLSSSDLALLNALGENARISTTDLAKRLGVSRNTVQVRMERLERSGIIRGYTLKLAESYESTLVKAHISIVVVPKFAAKVEAALQKIAEVRQLYAVSGAIDMIAVVVASNVQALDMIVNRIGMLEGVERTMSAIILSTRMDR